MYRMAGIAAALMAAAIGSAQAQVAFSDNFTNGVDFTTNDPFWLDNNRANGFVVQNANALFGGEFAGQFNSGVGGSGYFLFDGTYFYNPSDPSNHSIPAGDDLFYIGSSFAAVQNTTYSISFWLNNASGGANAASVQPEIDGTLLGSPVSASGAENWQQFTFTWNSGTNTSASLILHNFTTTVIGNDFGVDDILVAAPEPGTAALLGIGALALAIRRRRKG